MTGAAPLLDVDELVGESTGDLRLPNSGNAKAIGRGSRACVGAIGAPILCSPNPASRNRGVGGLGAGSRLEAIGHPSEFALAKFGELKS